MIRMFICSYHLLNKHIKNIYTIVTEFDIKVKIKEMCTNVYDTILSDMCPTVYIQLLRMAYTGPAILITHTHSPIKSQNRKEYHHACSIK